MKVERIQSTPNSLLPERSADKLETERKGTLTNNALSFEEEKRQSRERQHQDDEEKNRKFPPKNDAPGKPPAHVDIVV